MLRYTFPLQGASSSAVAISKVAVAPKPLLERTQQSAFPLTNSPCPFDVICGSSSLGQNFINGLECTNAYFDPNAEVKLILDIPHGHAFQVIEALNAGPSRSDLRLVVMSFSTCAEYLCDLWDLQPDILIDGTKATPDLAGVIRQASTGKRYLTGLLNHTLLTPTERQILRLLVRGHSNKDIASTLSLQEKTVRNLLTHIYGQLNVESRTEAALHYWGVN